MASKPEVNRVKVVVHGAERMTQERLAKALAPVVREALAHR